MSVGFNLKEYLNKPECLACLVEISCPSFRDSVTVSRNLKQLRFSYRFRTGRRHFPCLCSIAMRKVDGCRICNHKSLVKVFLLNIFRVAGVKLIHCFNHLFDDSCKTNGQDLAIVYAHMAYAAVEIIAYCKYSVGNTVLCLLRHIGIG